MQTAPILASRKVEARHRRASLNAATGAVPGELAGQEGAATAVGAAHAHLERTARGLAWGAFTNPGYTCVSLERVGVERAFFAPLLQRVVALTPAAQVGNPLARAADLGPGTTLEPRGRWHGQVVAAMTGRGPTLTGGRCPRGQNFLPAHGTGGPHGGHRGHAR